MSFLIKLFRKGFRVLVSLFRYNKGANKEATKREFGIEAFLPEAVYVKLPPKDYNKEKIKVIILHHAPAFWYCIESLYWAFEQDEKFDVKIILLDFLYDQSKRQMDSLGINYVFEKEYDVEKDMPDILVHTSIPGRNVTETIDKYKGRFKYVMTFMSGLAFSTEPENLYQNFRNTYFRFDPDVMAFDALTYKQVVGTNDKIKYIEMGNPAFDGLFEASKEREYSGEFEKLKGLTTIMWAFDHGIYNKKIHFDCTFDIFARPILDYVKNSSEVGLIIRPHPTFIREMIANEIWSPLDLYKIKQFCKCSTNIIWDDDPCYFRSYAVSDAFLVDAYTSMSVSALPLGKPVCALYRNDQPRKDNNRELLDHYYSAENGKEVIKFLDNVVSGSDYMKRERLASIKKCVTAFDGQNGRRMKEYIYSEFSKKIEKSEG